MAQSSSAGTMPDRMARGTTTSIVPSDLDAPVRGVILMLHGCTQTPEDFATGTRMNDHAERHGLIVAYPEQAPAHNATRCWNWFRPGDRTRSGGEARASRGSCRHGGGRSWCAARPRLRGRPVGGRRDGRDPCSDPPPKSSRPRASHSGLRARIGQRRGLGLRRDAGRPGARRPTPETRPRSSSTGQPTARSRR